MEHMIKHNSKIFVTESFYTLLWIDAETASIDYLQLNSLLSLKEGEDNTRMKQAGQFLRLETNQSLYY